MGTLLGGRSLLLGALPARQKLKIPRGLVLPGKSLREIQTYTPQCQVILNKNLAKPLRLFAIIPPCVPPGILPK